MYTWMMVGYLQVCERKQSVVECTEPKMVFLILERGLLSSDDGQDQLLVLREREREKSFFSA